MTTRPKFAPDLVSKILYMYLTIPCMPSTVYSHPTQPLYRSGSWLGCKCPISSCNDHCNFVWQCFHYQVQNPTVFVILEDSAAVCNEFHLIHRVYIICSSSKYHNFVWVIPNSPVLLEMCDTMINMQSMIKTI